MTAGEELRERIAGALIGLFVLFVAGGLLLGADAGLKLLLIWFVLACAAKLAGVFR